VLANQLQLYNDMFASVSDSITDSQLFSGGSGPADFSSMLTAMQASVAQADSFAESLSALKAMGLNKTTFAQLAQAGPAAAQQAAALVAAGTSGIKQINTLQGQLGTAGESAGKTAADYLYKGSVNAAQAFVNTIAKNKNALARQMTLAGNALVRAVRTAINRTAGGLTTGAIKHGGKYEGGKAVMPKGGWVVVAKKHADGVARSSGGLAMVGERGPELVTLPRGAGVIDAKRTAAMLARGQGATVTTVSVSLNVRMEDLSQIRTLEQFLKMLDQARVTSRKTMRSGAVTA
jgi:hypothetical protein